MATSSYIVILLFFFFLGVAESLMTRKMAWKSFFWALGISLVLSLMFIGFKSEHMGWLVIVFPLNAVLLSGASLLGGTFGLLFSILRKKNRVNAEAASLASDKRKETDQ